MYIYDMSCILTLDISSASTGVCVFTNGRIIYNDTIKPGKKSHAERLLIFEVTLRAIVAKYNPSMIAIEDCWQGSNRKTFKILALYHGVAYKLCYELLRTDPYVIMPSEIRKLIGAKAGINLLPSRKKKRLRGDGSDSKKLTFDFIKDMFKLNEYTFENNNDHTDAIAVALAYNLVIGDEFTRSLFNSWVATGSERRGGQESLPEPRIPKSPRQKSRKQRSRRKV